MGWKRVLRVLAKGVDRATEKAHCPFNQPLGLLIFDLSLT